MESSKVRLEQIAEPENLREAFLRAARGKGHRQDVADFRASLDCELVALRSGILGGNMSVGHFTSFTIFEPKERRIHAPCFRERVLHHALVGRYSGRHQWFLKLDVRKYFDSIPHAQLLAEIERRFRDKRVFALWRGIVASYETEPGRGLPIGALTSQYLANFYLGAVDRLVKEKLRVPGYVRYMDDMALWGDKDLLMAARCDVDNYLWFSLGLALKANWHLQPVRRGMDFLGYRVGPHGSTLNRPSRRRFLRRWNWCERALLGGRIDESQAQRRVLALTAFVRVAQRETILNRLFGTIWSPAIGHQPRQSRRQLEQLGGQLPLRQPQQERPGEPQQQPRLPPRPQLTPGGPLWPPD